MKTTINLTTAFMNQESSINSKVELNTKLPNRAKICLSTNIDTASSNGAKAQSKVHIPILTSSSVLVDKNIFETYHGHKEELDEIAKDWVELVLKQLMEKHS